MILTYVGRVIVGFGTFNSFSVEIVVLNDIGEGTLVVFQGVFEDGSSFAVINGFAL
jgi:hypothetical protein